MQKSPLFRVLNPLTAKHTFTSIRGILRIGSGTHTGDSDIGIWTKAQGDAALTGPAKIDFEVRHDPMVHEKASSVSDIEKIITEAVRRDCNNVRIRAKEDGS